jgi:hypothetical protein
MNALVLLRWIASRWVREPWKWALFLALVAVWPALQSFTPFGLPSGAARSGIAYEIAFVAAVAGTACALDALETLPACERELGIRSGWFSEWVAVALASSAVQAAALTVPAIGWAQARMFSLAVNQCLQTGWLSGVAVVALRLPIPRGLRPIAFLLATWALPAFLPSTTWSSLLGAMTHALTNESAIRLHAASRVASISALLLALRLVDAQRARRS